MNEHASLVLPAAEHRERLAAARRFQEERGLDALLVDQTEALFYFTGFDLSEILYRCCVIPRDGEIFVVVRQTDVGAFEENSCADRSFGYLDWADPIAALAARLGERGLGRARIGVDFSSYCMTLRRFAQLRALLPEATFVDTGDFFTELRVRKSPAEIALIRKAAAVADAGYVAARAALGPGRSQREGIAAASAAYVMAGADTGRVGFVTSGRGWNFFHKPIGEGPLATGDVVHFEFAPRVKGYCARMMRPVIIGAASAKQEEVAARLIAIQDRQIAAMTAGAIARDVDAICREAILAEGLRDTYPNATAYALGHVPWASPRTSDHSRHLTPESRWPLEPGMVFHVIVSSQGIAFSETVLITDGPPESLGRSERRLAIGTNAARAAAA
ncbi:MAG: aminopeptidase P family protein [Alphaproteobacteria bacterium]|nr:aminopeptidase P family protein [Alphaproteobacteria bacterium]